MRLEILNPMPILSAEWVFLFNGWKVLVKPKSKRWL